MTTWFTSDHHFGHKNIIRLTGRPFTDIDEMHRVMKSHWNEKIAPTDTVYYVGDFSFMKILDTYKFLNQLNGTKILIQGNHDKQKYIPGEGWDQVLPRLEIQLEKHKILLCHYPYKGTKEEIEHAKVNGYELRYIERRPEDKGGWLIHGHVHQHWKFKKRMINVSVEPWNYYPISEHEIVNHINTYPSGYNGN